MRPPTAGSPVPLSMQKQQCLGQGSPEAGTEEPRPGGAQAASSPCLSSVLPARHGLREFLGLRGP